MKGNTGYQFRGVGEAQGLSSTLGHLGVRTLPIRTLAPWLVMHRSNMMYAYIEMSVFLRGDGEA